MPRQANEDIRGEVRLQLMYCKIEVFKTENFNSKIFLIYLLFFFFIFFFNFYFYYIIILYFRNIITKIIF